MPGYSYLSLGAARSILSGRLQDPLANSQWTVAEANAAIVLAVQMWQAFTAGYRQRVQFQTVAATTAPTPFYDLTSAVTPAVLGYSMTDQTLVTTMLAYLLEPPLIPVWTGTGIGTGQFTFSQISSALQNRLNRFLGDSGCSVTRLLQAFPAAPQPRVYLADTVLDVRRAAWDNGTRPLQPGTISPLFRDDEWAVQAFSFSEAQTPADPPLAFTMFAEQPVGLRVSPPPLNNGTLDLITVQSGVTINTTVAGIVADPVVLGITDYLCWGIMFGALSDLLSSDGPGMDPERAQYCEQRYMEAVVLSKVNPSVLLAQANNQPLWTGSVFDLDTFQNSWQSVPGPPQFAGLAGRNLLAIAPVPDAIYGISADVVPNIPVPVLDADFLQVDRGSVAPVLDQAQHLLSFKLGGAEFQGTAKLNQNFQAGAALVNSRLHNLAVFGDPMQKTRERQQREMVRV